MNIRTVEGVRGAGEAMGDVVVIDVLRAFTTAACAFAAGIEEIELVATVEEALARPGFRLGEVGGNLIPGFDHNNSPSQLIGRQLGGRAVQRTGAGTQCVVAATRAETIWLSSLVVLSATARALRAAREVTLVISGAPTEGEEDRAAAMCLEALLRDERPPLARAIEMVRASRAASLHRPGDPDRPIEDLDICCDVDRFDFAMRVDGRIARGVLG